jgi:hypothetical protein
MTQTANTPTATELLIELPSDKAERIAAMYREAYAPTATATLSSLA